MKKAVVLSSGGVDSTTCLAVAIGELGASNVCAVSVFYGQKHEKELQCAKNVANYYKIPHFELDLSNCGIFEHSNCSLLNHSSDNIPHSSYGQQVNESCQGVSTYVPFRNGLMLSAVASFALSIYSQHEIDIYLGAHGDDAAGNAYADCSELFVSYMKQAIFEGTYGKVNVVCPFVGQPKSSVVKRGLELNVPYELTWSCYEGGDKPCGVCGTCRDRISAFESNGVADPIMSGGDFNE